MVGQPPATPSLYLMDNVLKLLELTDNYADEKHPQTQFHEGQAVWKCGEDWIQVQAGMSGYVCQYHTHMSRGRGYYEFFVDYNDPKSLRLLIAHFRTTGDVGSKNVFLQLFDPTGYETPGHPKPQKGMIITSNGINRKLEEEFDDGWSYSCRITDRGWEVMPGVRLEFDLQFTGARVRFAFDRTQATNPFQPFTYAQTEEATAA